MPQLGIAPRIRTEKHHKLISGIQNDISRLRGHLRIAAGKALRQTADLFKAAIARSRNVSFQIFLKERFQLFKRNYIHLIVKVGVASDRCYDHVRHDPCECQRLF